MLATVRRISRAARGAIFGLCVCAAPAFATTWIVDVNNGPGANFTSISAAIAASVPGDVIRVRQGSYSTFTLGRGITILGEGFVYVTSPRVIGVPAGEVAILSQLIPIGNLGVTDCIGTVLLQSQRGSTFVFSCADVRILKFREFGAPLPGEGLQVENSRVQTVQSNFRGWDGEDSNCVGLADGGYPGIEVRGAGRLHAAMTNSVGGRGGDGCWAYAPGWGGPGISGYQPSGGLLEIILCGAGGVGSATGSSGGAGSPFPPHGGSLVLAGNVLGQSSQMTYAPTPPSAAAGATYVVLPTIEPTLELIGSAFPAVTMTLRLRATPGTVVRLNVGRTPALNSAPGVLIENLVLKERSFDRGTVPPSGIIDTPWLTQPSAPLGKLLIFQAKVTDPFTGRTQKSNSIDTVVR